MIRSHLEAFELFLNSHLNFRFKTNLSLIIFCFTALTSQAFAQFRTDERQDQIIRNQQNIIEQENRQKEFGRIQKEREQLKKPEEEKDLSEKEALKSGKCFEIKTIELIGADSLSKRAREKITAPFINECFNNLTFSKLVKSVNSHYQNTGYVTTQVTIPAQNIKEGILRLQIIEGKIHDLSVNEDKFTDKMQEFTAFGFTKNKK